MKATETRFLPFIRKSPRFVIPIYQRTYSWTEKECQQLWDDILRTGADAGVSAHFIGSIVYVQDGLYNVSIQAPLLVIDGQQRLTSVTLLLAALARHLATLPADDQEPADGFSPRKLRNYYLVNPDEDGDDRYRLTLSKVDRDTLTAIVEQRELPTEHSLRVQRNFEFFGRMLQEGANLVHICEGLAKLLVVDVSLDRTQDNPQLIFESMNSTGRELSQADLIRNYVLMGLPPKQQTDLYEQYWLPMELDFGQEAYGEQFDAFMRHYLSLKLGEIPRRDRIYEMFKAYARRTDVATAGVEALVAGIRRSARHYSTFALGKEPDPALRVAFDDLRELKTDVVYPFLLEVYNDYADGRVKAADVEQIVRVIESFVFRRAIVGMPTNVLSRLFPTIGRSLRKDQYLESFRATLALYASYRRFPTDEEFHAELQRRDLYNNPRRSYVLRRLENAGRKERVEVGQYTIEHIMPQNPTLPAAWRRELGEEWERIHSTWLHTLGNLTLTGYNSEYSDRPFAEKRDMEGGFAQSPLKLNTGLGKVERWNEDAIRERAARLATEAVRIWSYPSLPASVLEEYRPAKRVRGEYTLDDHPHVADPKMRALFDALKREILALDPVIVEEILKLYVAFKADTNVVDVVPQKARLRLSINIPFTDIKDPLRKCKDVTGLGRWGNGDVEIFVASEDDIPYVIGLVRQALERQMGTEEIAP